MMVLTVHSCGPGVTLQDQGRPGFLAQGLSRGGAMDQLALAEGAALLRQPLDCAVEMAGFGGAFSASVDLRIALTGAPMRASLDGAALRWNASHMVPAGARLEIGAVTSGSYGYLTLGGGIASEPVLNAQGAHLTAGLGRALRAGDTLPLGKDSGGDTNLTLPEDARFNGGPIRVLPSLQTDLFSADQIEAFQTRPMTRDTRGNRMGVRLLPEDAEFGLTAGGTILSEVITPGDIQIPGDGMPYVLLAECQTTGGYPRIGTVIPADLPRVAQAPAGAQLQFRFVTLDQALEAEARYRKHLSELPRKTYPLIRDPADMADLLSYSLISGVTAGEELS